MQSFERNWMKRARFLMLALIFSGTLNIGFLSAFIYSNGKEGKLVHETISPQKTRFTNEQILRSYRTASFADLLLRLESKELIEEGYAKRDLALACLSAFHHFGVEKALGGISLQKRILSFQVEQEVVEVEAFAGLKDEHFEALLQFARVEKWPFTAKGLFNIICQSPYPYDPSLLEAFYCKVEFHSLYSLVQKYDPLAQKPLLVSLLKEGSWELLQKFSKKLVEQQSYTEETWQEFLTSYALDLHSKIAADFLWRREKEYVLKRWNDTQLAVFLDLLREQKEREGALALELLTSQRSDSIRQKAAEILYLQVAEEVPNPCDYTEALRRFCPKKEGAVFSPAASLFPVVTCAAPMKKAEMIHVVQAGDSLWKISRKYGVSIDAIIKLNQLESDRLRQGRKLQIPDAN